MICCRPKKNNQSCAPTKLKKMRQFTGTMSSSNLKAYSLISKIEAGKIILAGSILLVQKSWILMQKFT
jgi:hypothetical protein